MQTNDSTTTTLRLDEIEVDRAYQPREQTDAETVHEYQQAMQAGAEFPAVTVFLLAGKHTLVDGFHRHAAAQQAGRTSLPAQVLTGTEQEAVLFALRANRKHGRRPTVADRRKMATMLFVRSVEFGFSQRQIAEECGISHVTAGKWFDEWRGEQAHAGGQMTTSDERQGADGKTYDFSKRREAARQRKAAKQTPTEKLLAHTRKRIPAPVVAETLPETVRNLRTYCEQLHARDYATGEPEEALRHIEGVLVQAEALPVPVAAAPTAPHPDAFQVLTTRLGETVERNWLPGEAPAEVAWLRTALKAALAGKKIPTAPVLAAEVVKTNGGPPKRLFTQGTFGHSGKGAA